MATHPTLVWPHNYNALPSEAFVREDIYKEELERIFYGAEWHPVAHESEVPEPGDFKTTTLLGNVKNAITGTYHAIRGQHAPRYLAELEYRFNRRYDLKSVIPRFLTVAARTPPMPYRLLKLADPYA